MSTFQFLFMILAVKKKNRSGKQTVRTDARPAQGGMLQGGTPRHWAAGHDTGSTLEGSEARRTQGR